MTKPRVVCALCGISAGNGALTKLTHEVKRKPVCKDCYRWAGHNTEARVDSFLNNQGIRGNREDIESEVAKLEDFI
jgi:ribosome-binding protein aMBF1 (putative translation factor)